MREILAGIHAWSVYNQEKGLDFNGHLVATDGGCVLIDPPAMSPEDMARLEALGPVESVIITNCHHTRDAMTFAAKFQARILLPEKDAASIPTAVRLGGTFRPGELLPGGLLVVGLADQKSPGESALVCGRAGALILGDALIGKPPGALSMLPPAKYADAAKARAGLRALLAHTFDAVLLGDGVSIPTGGRKALESFLARD